MIAGNACSDVENSQQLVHAKSHGKLYVAQGGDVYTSASSVSSGTPCRSVRCSLKSTVRSSTFLYLYTCSPDMHDNGSSVGDPK